MTRRSRASQKRKGGPPDPVRTLALAQVKTWKEAEREALFALLEKTSSDLQREFLLRALAAAHSPGEMTSFARRIRLMTDRALATACTVTVVGPNGTRRTLAQLLRAEADPLYAFILNGQSLESVRHDQDQPQQPAAIQAVDAAFPASGKRRHFFELGSEEPRPRQGQKAARDRDPFEDELCRAVQALGFRYQVEAVGDGGLSVDDAVSSVVDALWAGRPVPAVLGNLRSEGRRRVLFLQCWNADRGTAMEVHDPHTGEVVWINDVDLRAEKELPLSNKALRRLLEVALPLSSPSGRGLG